MFKVEEINQLLTMGFTKDDIVKMTSSESVMKSTATNLDGMGKNDPGTAGDGGTPQDNAESPNAMQNSTEQYQEMQKTITTLQDSVKQLSEALQKKAIEESSIEVKTGRELADELVASFINPKGKE